MALSLRSRLLAVSVAVLIAFVVLTGLVLDRAFRDSADTAQQARLEALLYLLMGSLEVDADGTLHLPAQLPEARLALPASGLYAAIRRVDADDGAAVRAPTRWRSPSAIGVDLALEALLEAGERRNEVRTGGDGMVYRVLTQGVRWEIGERPSRITFSVAAPLAARGADVASYRHSLWTALAAMAVALLFALVLVQRWGLRPLRRLARDIAAMEAGEARRPGAGAHPRELAPLVDNLDRLLAREHALVERQRKALADLAHSLKTPLAILRNAAPDDSLPAVVGEQARRMEDIVHYQLQRAATAGASRLAAARPLAPLVDRLLASLGKVHGQRRLELVNAVPVDLGARIDEGDALELLGNLADNACKWAAGRVVVSAVRQGGGLRLSVDDDGPGFPDGVALPQRGLRGDERTPGHGIGLAMAHDIALAYGGELSFARSPLGGARVSVWLAEC